MSIYVIGDLHLSFNENKPMDIFGENWRNHEEKIKKDWEKKVKPQDTVILIGDFSWSMGLQNTLIDFEYINNLPGKKILLKGNHDYWWTTLTNIRKFLVENNINDIEFLQNNSFCIENKIICGTRGWNVNSFEQTEHSLKMIKRECQRLELSIQDGIKNYGDDKEIIAFLHYPPILKMQIFQNEITPFIEILKKYDIKKCYYGHLHGSSIKTVEKNEIYEGIELILASADGVDFKLQKIKE